jgi:hypothetical protein
MSLALAFSAPVLAQAQGFTPLGTEYSVSGNLPGDQIHPSLSLSPNGGYLVWQDNAIDGAGSGIAAQKLDGNFSGFYGYFRVNQQSTGNQEKPQVTLLTGGGTAIVWQGGRLGRQNIYARFLTPSGTFSSSTDIRINTYTNSTQTSPAIAALSDGNAIVAWSSKDQDGSMEGVYARVVSPVGQNLGSPFLVNQYTAYSQRDPAVAVLTNGNVVVVWVSENQGLTPAELSGGRTTADIYARLFSRSGQPLGAEFKINTASNICANPSVAKASDGGFVVAWSQKDIRPNSWDIYARSFGASGASAASALVVNSTTYGDQYSPRVSALGANHLVVWTSLGQDGSGEGIYGRLLSFGELNGPEFQVHTSVIGKQVYPAVSSDGTGRFLAAWSSFGAKGFDVFAQRFAAGQPIPRPDAPWVRALTQTNLLVSWPSLAGYQLAGYEVYMDGATNPTAVVTGNFWTAGELAPGSSHSFSIAYRLTSGASSLLSPAATGTTWGADLNGDGLPDDWQAQFWPGVQPSAWPGASVDSDGDGVSNLKEFLAGTDPRNAASALKVRLSLAGAERRLVWNTEAGLVYQVQKSLNFTTWFDLGLPRFAAGSTDSLVLSGGEANAYYRVVRVQ